MGVFAMKGITFGNIHSYRDLRLILESKEMGSPAVKVRKVDVEGADGALDYTDFFGEAKYENATHKFTFSTIVPQEEFLSQFSQVKNALHGRKVRIILDDDPTFFYLGRLSVSPFTSSKAVGKLTVEADCEPYKMKISPTVITKTISGSLTFNLPNSRKRVVPEVKIAAESGLNIVYQVGNVWDLSSGTYTLPELELVEGNNTVTVTGTGTISFTWQEGEM
jgi:phage-related protein